MTTTLHVIGSERLLRNGHRILVQHVSSPTLGRQVEGDRVDLLSVHDSLQTATRFQILLLFTVVLMRWDPSGAEVCTACQAGALATTYPGVWKETPWSMVPPQEPGDRQRWCSFQRGLRTWRSPEQLMPSFPHIQPELSPVLREWP